MVDEEEELTSALVAIITGTRPHVSTDDVTQLLCSMFEFEEGDFTIHFGSPTSVDRMNGDHHVRCPCFSLSLRPWCKLAPAGFDRFEYRVGLELRGIPAQVWHMAMAKQILSGECSSASNHRRAPVRHVPAHGSSSPMPAPTGSNTASSSSSAASPPKSGTWRWRSTS